MSTCRTVQPVSSPDSPSSKPPGRPARSSWRRLTRSPHDGATVVSAGSAGSVAGPPGRPRWTASRWRTTWSWAATADSDGVVGVLAGGALEVEQGLGGLGVAVDEGAGQQVGEEPDAVHEPDVDRFPASAEQGEQRRTAASPNRRGTGSPSPPRPVGSSSSRRASANRPESARASTAPSRWATSTLTQPAGPERCRRRRAAPRAGRRRTRERRGTARGRRRPRRRRSARAPASPCSARTRPATPASAARRCSAARASGLGSTTVTRCPSPASGTANPPVPPPTSTTSSDGPAGRPRTARRRSGVEGVPDDGGPDRRARVGAQGPAAGRGRSSGPRSVSRERAGRRRAPP